MNCNEVNVKWSKEGLPALEQELARNGADIIRFANLSGLSEKISRGFDKAILIGLLLSKEYVADLCKPTQASTNEYAEKEHQADKLAEWTGEFLHQHGYHAFAQSEANIGQYGYFDTKTKSSVLPHKTIALLGGVGWIGKNNLLITEDYGCAFCMCSVLTDAPLDVTNPPLMSSKCGQCYICKQVCPTQAILGNVWSQNCGRDRLVDVFRCEACLKCLAHCPWTVRYAASRGCINQPFTR